MRALTLPSEAACLIPACGAALLHKTLQKAARVNELAAEPLKRLFCACRTPVSSVRDLIHVGKARELETLVLIDMIKHQKVPNSEEQRAEIEAMEHEAEGLEKLYREGQGGYWLKYPNGTISTHRLSFKEYRHQLRSDIKYVPKLLKIHEKTAKMHLEHVKLRQRILGWGNTTVADSAAVVLDRLFRRRQEDLRAAQLFVPWHQRYHTAIEGHETMKRDFKEELVVLRREMSKLRRGGKDTEEYIKRKKQNWLDQATHPPPSCRRRR